jgi:hypothetical protein
LEGFVRVKRKVLVVSNGVIRKYKCDLTVDPFTQAPNGMIRLVINAYFDAKPRRTEAFVKKILK